MRTLLVAITCFSLITSHAFSVTQANQEDQGISELVVEYYGLVRRIGKTHPTTELMRRKIEHCINDGDDKLDQRLLGIELEKGFRKFRELSVQIGLKHPSTQAQLYKISVVSRLLMTEETISLKNLDDLLAESSNARSNDETTRRTTD